MSTKPAEGPAKLPSDGRLEAQGLPMKTGTNADATISNAASSTKNATNERNPGMKQTRNGEVWPLGTQVHVGTDRRGTVHALSTTEAPPMATGGGHGYPIARRIPMGARLSAPGSHATERIFPPRR